MRPDGKPEGLRQSMSWVHTYTGLLLGWLLYAVFFTGTFSYFRSEVNDWMRPELHRVVYNDQAVERTLAALQERAPDATSWTLNLPGPRRVAMSASWRGTDPATGRAANGNITMDPGTGEQLSPRRTSASNFFYRFHFELHWFSRTNGRLIVGFATMLMFIAIISGVITHKKIFSDFFTFRPKKGQRSWLDAHNATAVLALPFHIIITFSGLILIAGTLTPSFTFQGLGGADQRGGGGGGGRGAAVTAPGGPGGQAGQGGQQGGQGNQRVALNTPGGAGGPGGQVNREAAGNNALRTGAGPEGRGAGNVENRGNPGAERGGNPTRTAAGPEGRGGNPAERGGQPANVGDSGNAGGERANTGGGNVARVAAGGQERGGQQGGQPGGQQGGRQGQGGQGGRGDGQPGGGNAAPQAGSQASARAPLAKAPMAPVLTMLHEASQHWAVNGVNSLTINDPGTVKAVVSFNERYSNSLLSGGRGGGRTMRFNGVTGELIEATETQPSTASFVRKIRNAIVAIHEGRFAGEVTRWLLFLSGVLGTFMAASGMVLWVVKRLPERKKLGRTPIPHRIVELLNVGAIAGLSIAMASLFWSNRLLPADLANRGTWEVDIFFYVWGVCLLHPLFFSHRNAWLQQMSLAALMYGLLPILNPLTGGAPLWQTIPNGQWSVAHVDLILLAMAALHGGIVWWLLKKPAAKPVPGAAKAPPVGAKLPPAGATPGGKPPPKAAPKPPPSLPPRPAPVPGGMVPAMAKVAGAMATPMGASAASLAPAAAVVSSLVDAAAPILEHAS